MYTVLYATPPPKTPLTSTHTYAQMQTHIYVVTYKQISGAHFEHLHLDEFGSIYDWKERCCIACVALDDILILKHNVQAAANYVSEQTGVN